MLKTTVVAIATITSIGFADAQDVTEPFRQWEGELRFPSNVLEPDDPSYWLNANRYSSYFLDGLGEPALFDQALVKGDWKVRLTVLPSFSADFTARIEAKGDTSILVYKVGNSGGWGPITAFDTTFVQLDRTATETVLNLIEGSMICSRGHDKKIGFDGSTWILEYKDTDQYCGYQEWSPRGDFFHDIFRLVHLAIGMRQAEIDELLTYY